MLTLEKSNSLYSPSRGIISISSFQDSPGTGLSLFSLQSCLALAAHRPQMLAQWRVLSTTIASSHLLKLPAGSASPQGRNWVLVWPLARLFWGGYPGDHGVSAVPALRSDPAAFMQVPPYPAAA